MIRNGQVACNDCGALVDDATRHLAEMAAKLAEVQTNYENAKDLAVQRHAAAKRLQSDQAKDPKANPNYQAAMRVLRNWQRLCAPRTRELNGPRLTSCLARMNHGYTEADLDKAVVGYSRYPYVIDSKRAAVGPADKRYVDAELIFRDAKHVDAGIAMAENDSANGVRNRPDMGLPPSVLGALDWRTVQRANFKMLKAALTKQFGQPLLDDSLSPSYLFPCPRCHPEATIRDRATVTIAERLTDVPLTLTLNEPGRSSLARCYACGIDEGLLLQALKDPVGLAVV